MGRAADAGTLELPGGARLAVIAGDIAAGGARELGAHSTIVMPHTTPEIKVDAVRALGAEVSLVGDTVDQASVWPDSK